MDIMKLLIETVGAKLGIGNTDMLSGALQSLLGDGSGGIDIAALVQKFSGGGMEGLLSSFLGDGANEPMDATQVTELLGQDKLSKFASDVGVEPDSAANALSDALPQLLDKISTGGQLMDGLGDAKGLLGGIGKLF
ncbi:MAG: YidB family protein [Pseudomonadota bacterium]